MSAASSPGSANPLPDDNARLGYSGDIDPQTAFDLLAREKSAVLVDVRTIAEWNFVGVPDLSQLNKPVLAVEWQRYPDMAQAVNFNQQVEDKLAELQSGPEAPLVFICRSGARSRAAAIRMTQGGHARCYNLAGGFEGDVDGNGHRGKVNGWKSAGLPWLQR